MARIISTLLILAALSGCVSYGKAENCCTFYQHAAEFRCFDLLSLKHDGSICNCEDECPCRTIEAILGAQ